MNIKLSQSDLCLAKRQTLSLIDAAGVRIDARAGTVWVTQDHDVRDVVLRAGESFTFDGKGQAIVQAFEPSRVWLSQPGPAAKPRRSSGWAARLAGSFRRRLPQVGLA